jgi:cyclopropane-fatty-acyl-phospholipid synthase
MGLFSLEHSKAAYATDFVLYGCAVVGLTTLLALAGPQNQRAAMLALAGAGLAGWSLVEYLLHRFVLHGVPPFKGWHAQHHQHPTALLGAPLVLSAGLIATLVWLPAWLLGGPWRAGALTLGLSTGYLAYGLMHHFTHHGRLGNAWLARKRRWHAMHHARQRQPGCYGVTSPLWDHVFGSAPPSERVK